MIGPYAMQTGLNFLKRPESVVVSDYHICISMMIPWLPREHRWFGRSAPEVYHELVATRLHPRQRVSRIIETFYRERLADAPFLAVHVRGADKSSEQEKLADVNRSYFEHVDRVDPAMRIFLLTDDANVVNEFRARYGERVVTTSAERSHDQFGVHTRGGDGVRRGTEVVVDAYLAASADKFIGNGASNVSATVMHLKTWKDEDVIMLAPVRQYGPRPFLFEPQRAGLA